MKFIVTCGGSGGHVFPGVAAAKALRGEGHDVALLLSGRAVEGERPAGWDGEIIRVRIPQPRVKSPMSFVIYMTSFATCFRIVRKFKPDAMLAMGSYTSVPPALAARMCGVPLVLHESNAVPGAAVKFLSKFARVVCLAFEGCGKWFGKGVKTVVTGLPLREGTYKTHVERERPRENFTLLVMGGSQGARSLNNAVVGAIKILDKPHPDLRVVHLAGAALEAEVRAAYEGVENIAAEVVGFANNMGEIYAKTDFCISRAGASSCFELCANGIPALFVPLPKVSNDHQTHNARAMVETGCAEMLPQAEATAEAIAGRVEERIGKGKRDAGVETRDIIKNAAAKLAAAVAESV